MLCMPEQGCGGRTTFVITTRLRLFDNNENLATNGRTGLVYIPLYLIRKEYFYLTSSFLINNFIVNIFTFYPTQ